MSSLGFALLRRSVAADRLVGEAEELGQCFGVIAAEVFVCTQMHLDGLDRRRVWRVHRLVVVWAGVVGVEDGVEAHAGPARDAEQVPSLGQMVTALDARQCRRGDADLFCELTDREALASAPCADAVAERDGVDNRLERRRMVVGALSHLCRILVLVFLTCTGVSGADVVWYHCTAETVFQRREGSVGRSGTA